MKIYANGKIHFENGCSINRNPIYFRPSDKRAYWLVEVYSNNQHSYERRFEVEAEAKAFIDGFTSAKDFKPN